MPIYMTMLGVPALFALLGLGQEWRLGRLNAILLGLLFVAYAALIGLRFEIGADWFGYLALVRSVQYERLGTALSHYDPAFNLTAWTSMQIGWGMYGVNFVCGVFLLYGVFRFARTCPNPWLALSAAVPYLLVVVGMGYIRQAASIGLIMLSFVHLGRGQYLRFLAALVGALTFHIASLVVLPVIAVVLARRSIVLLVIVGAVGVLMAGYVLSARLDSVQTIYVKGQLDSSGTLVRLAMTALPAALFLGFRSRFDIPQPMKGIWTVMAVVALALLGGFIVSPSSTAIDRIGLFFSPLQVMVFGYVTSLFGRGRGDEQLVTLASVGYCAAVLFVWLHFSFYARFWVPYHSII